TAISQMFRGILSLICVMALCHRVVSFDSEVVEAATPSSQLASNSANSAAIELPKWSPSDVMVVKPYNILEASCPQGYILANKHCHKRVR
ncbi:hypothetical protein KR093_002646, partial [Drosophila rubida]